MLDVQAGCRLKLKHGFRWERAVSATDDATAPDDAAADRIEQALERIAALAARPRGAMDGAGHDPTIAVRLDAVIARLRQALGS
jgi:hypothetical protein